MNTQIYFYFFILCTNASRSIKLAQPTILSASLSLTLNGQISEMLDWVITHFISPINQPRPTATHKSQQTHNHSLARPSATNKPIETQIYIHRIRTKKPNVENKKKYKQINMLNIA